MPSKSPRQNTRKKRKIRRKEKIRTGIACGPDNQKTNAKKIPFEDVKNKTPKKKKQKKLFFRLKTPLPKYIYVPLTSRNLWKKSSLFQHLRPCIFLK
jgi:hypothetical protein